jgi:hypothetical protein
LTTGLTATIAFPTRTVVFLFITQKKQTVFAADLSFLVMEKNNYSLEVILKGRETFHLKASIE